MTPLVQYVRRNVIAFVALFVALSGTAYAGATLARNSVGATQIRANAVGSSEIKTNAVGSTEIRAGGVGTSEVKNGSLTRDDFQSGQLPAGATGPQGPAGPQGPKGDTGPVDSIGVRLNRGSGTTLTIGQSMGPATASTLLTWDNDHVEYERGGDLYDETLVLPPPFNGAATVTVPKDGTYLLSAGVRWAANALGQRALGINAPQPAGVIASSIVDAAASGRTVQNVASTTRLKAGDRVYVGVGQSSGGDLAIEGSQNQVHFAVTYVGP